MSKLSESIVVKCPYHLAQQFVADALRKPLGEPGVMTVRVPLAGIDVSKDVVATVKEGADPMHFDQPWKVHWTPLDGGPYPDFDGEITVRADEDYTTCLLEVTGDYRPPGGVLGQAFDALAGHKIAAATATALLEQIAAIIVARYQSIQAARHP
ncbi:MAG TPA: hypothetical protein VKB39_04690 [Candidatus Baltobacteraceae bacterium]|nr:hypothetical protein [Candidatus Baltobacteraceae bacterium]